MAVQLKRVMLRINKNPLSNSAVSGIQSKKESVGYSKDETLRDGQMNQETDKIFYGRYSGHHKNGSYYKKTSRRGRAQQKWVNKMRSSKKNESTIY